MYRTATARFALIGIISTALAVAAFGQVGTGAPQQEDKRIEIELTPTKLGEELGFAGVAVKGINHGVEMFGVRAVGGLPDGALLEVRIVTTKGEASVGTIEMFLGSGRLLVDSSRDISAAFPVNRIRETYVTFRGQEVLRGRFPG